MNEDVTPVLLQTSSRGRVVRAVQNGTLHDLMIRSWVFVVEYTHPRVARRLVGSDDADAAAAAAAADDDDETGTTRAAKWVTVNPPPIPHPPPPPRPPAAQCLSVTWAI